MKITTKVTVEQDFIQDIICNKCGESCINEGCPSPEGLIEITADGGYGSNWIGDGDSLTFSICERCLVAIVLEFKIPPDYYDRGEPDVTFQDWEARAKRNLGEASR